MGNRNSSFITSQASIFFLVTESFTTIYVLQPVLPVLQQELGLDEGQASLSISAVILGIALSTMPFGRLADRRPIKPIIAAGGAVVMLSGVGCALVQQMGHLIFFRFLQGLFIPAMTTCLAAYLAKNLPVERLNLAMGAYVSATVTGGLAGRLSNFMGNGTTLITGALVFAISMGITHIANLWMVGVGLCGICAGFFTIHAAVAGSLNQKLKSSVGRANGLYVLFYYIGGAAGITISGSAFDWIGWPGLTIIGFGLLAIIIIIGVVELRTRTQSS